MKKILLVLLSALLAACSTPTQQSTVPLDMKTVEAYQKRVASGNTVNPNEKQGEWELNHSDRVQKVKVYHHYHHTPVIVPSVSYQRVWGSPRVGGHIGINLGNID